MLTGLIWLRIVFSGTVRLCLKTKTETMPETLRLKKIRAVDEAKN
jgi:hypothetical protein